MTLTERLIAFFAAKPTAVSYTDQARLINDARTPFNQKAVLTAMFATGLIDINGDPIDISEITGGGSASASLILADVAELRTKVTLGVEDRAYFVRYGGGTRVYGSKTSADADDGDATIRPADHAASGKVFKHEL